MILLNTYVHANIDACIHHIKNEEVLHRANTNRKRLSVIMNRYVKFFGHVIQKDIF